MNLSVLKRFLQRRSNAPDMRRDDEILAEANEYLRDALNQDKQESVLLGVRARWVTMFVVALFLPYLNFSWEILYYEVLLGVFSFIGYLQLKASHVGHSKRELLLIFCDLALMTIICVVPNPFDDHEYPLAVQYRFNTFLYFFVLLAGATLAYSWRTILAYGVWTSVLWSGGLIYISLLGSEVPELSTNVAAALGDYGHLMQFLDPNDPNVPGRVQEILVFFIVAGILALRGWRANRLLLKQADASRERANLARHFAPSIVNQLAKSDQPFGSVRTQSVAIMFTDIVGFTSMAEQNDPEQVVSLLRTFHDHMERAVFNNHGTLDKFLGDGIMATFGTPDATPEDPTNALKCAGEMITSMDEWNVQRTQEGLEPIKLSVGIHYGDVVLGDIGSARRLEFATLGDAVNVSARLEAMTRELDTQVVVSDAFITAIKMTKGDEANELLKGYQAGEETNVRGRDQRIKIWTLSE